MRPVSFAQLSLMTLFMNMGLFIAVVVILRFNRNVQPKSERFTKFSVEYKQPQKCFDCIQQTSQNHWNVSNGIPRYFIGM